MFRRYPFILILKRVIENPNLYPLTLKIDPGSKFSGIALATNRGDVIWGMELQHRGQQIKDALKHRYSVRRGRRNRISNLCLACHKCNQRKGNKDIKDFLKGKADVPSEYLDKLSYY